MPLPIILATGAVIAATVGLGTGVHGAVKMKKAKDNMKSVNFRHNRNIAHLKRQSQKVSMDMDSLGRLEFEILESFEKFSEILGKIQNKPQFKTYAKDGVQIPEYKADDLKQVSIGASILLGGISGAAIGTFGAFAAAGATTAAVTAVGTASTGVAISTLSGVAATNATLAALGGGALAAGGGGMALGTIMLGTATLGVGLLVGGVIFNITGHTLSSKVEVASSQMKKAEEEINKICLYMTELSGTANKYEHTISRVNKAYLSHLSELIKIVVINKKTDWVTFSDIEKQITENAVLLVGLLFNMCKVQLVLASENETEPNRVDAESINKSILSAEIFLNEKGLSIAF